MRRSPILLGRWKSVGLILLIMLSIAFPLYAGYHQGYRPITNGTVDQTYLYDEYSSATGTRHKGLDFPYATGTAVRAIAAGTVTNLREDLANGTGSGFGNFVLLRHDQMYGGQYVYSIYAHLAYNSVIPALNQRVNAGDQIGSVDTTGNVTGAHLHLQICLHLQADRQVWPTNTLDSENTSRNSEIWLSPLNGNTGYLVGVVRDANGNPLIGSGNIRMTVWGAVKPAPENIYQWSTVYQSTWANRDDVFDERFATVDVSPGTYNLQAKWINELNPTPTPYASLGSYTVRAGEITFVSLYPVYLPDIGRDTDNTSWNSTIKVKNLNQSVSASVKISYFDLAGNRQGVTTGTIAAGSVATFTPPMPVNDWIGQAVVVSSQDIAVVVENQAPGRRYAYSGIVPSTGSDNAGFGMAGKTIRLPVMMKNYYNGGGWYTAFAVMNTGVSTATVTITYYDDNGNSIPAAAPNPVAIPVNGAHFRDQAGENLSNNRIVYAAVLTSDQPVAVVVRQYNGTSSALAYNGFSGGKSPSYTPSLMKNYYGWNSSLTVQNVGSGLANISVTYYTITGTVTEGAPNVPSKASRVFYQPNNSQLPDGNQNGLFAAKITANSDIAVVVNQSLTNTVQALSYNGFQGGSGLSWQPWVMKNAGGWNSSVVVQNVGSGTTNITLTYDSGVQETRNNVAQYRHALFYQGNSTISDGEHWAKVTAGQNIVAVVNASASGTQDLAWSYNGFSR